MPIAGRRLSDRAVRPDGKTSGTIGGRVQLQSLQRGDSPIDHAGADAAGQLRQSRFGSRPEGGANTGRQRRGEAFDQVGIEVIGDGQGGILPSRGLPERPALDKSAGPARNDDSKEEPWWRVHRQGFSIV